MKIILCSKNEAILQRWQKILADQQFGIFPVASPQVLEATVQKDKDYLLLMHQSFTGQQGVGRLCRALPKVKIFILSDSPDEEDGIQLLKLGVIGYANTYISPARLLEAVKTVQSGRVWFEHEIISRLIHSLNTGRSRLAETGSNTILESLTQREKEIAVLVAEGLSNQLIGQKLYISERTVKSHIGSIFQKTGAMSRVKLALLLQNHC